MPKENQEKAIEELQHIDPNSLTKEQAKQELERIASTIISYDIAYHQEDAPIVSDAEYDALKRRNDAIESLFPDLILSNSPTYRVGYSPNKSFKKAIAALRQLPHEVLPESCFFIV